jgi:hypothetical protein
VAFFDGRLGLAGDVFGIRVNDDAPGAYEVPGATAHAYIESRAAFGRIVMLPKG